jgi:hypothetical protein
VLEAQLLPEPGPAKLDAQMPDAGQLSWWSSWKPAPRATGAGCAAALSRPDTLAANGTAYGFPRVGVASHGRGVAPRREQCA